ncbi:BREX-2 system phosphatase PglZ [Streptomyces sp. NPDC060187]|uniref:BREX-2 system phosphatase PglZ n=1 Tax=Streptomyces sp. NPDC060187 TaxID=3347067 RepID=UPI00364FB2E7
MTATSASLPVIRALIDQARSKQFEGGVIGILARPEWDGPAEFEHESVPVRVMPCPSALAVREALLSRSSERWLVVLTDRDTDDLGLGITAHLVGKTLRQPDPWEAVRDGFGATRLDHRLVTAPHPRDLANGFLTATPEGGWAPARGGLLTPDHAFSSLASARLGLGRAGGEIDSGAVLAWSSHPASATSLADLRSLAGDTIVDALLNWIGRRTGATGKAVAPLLRSGRSRDAVPLGLVTRAVLSSAMESGPRALLRAQLGERLSDPVLQAWASDSETVTTDLLVRDSDAAAHVLARAETLLDTLEAGSFADASGFLRRGLSSRLATLGEALRLATERASVRARSHGPDAPLADLARLPAVEQALAEVESHALAGHPDESRVPRAHAAVRLTRWLARPAHPLPTKHLDSHVARHRDHDAWVDRAADDVWTGVSDEGLAQGLRTVLAAARLRRSSHDLAFAAALARHEGDGKNAPGEVANLEEVMGRTVLPLAKAQPVLLIIADGMSASVASEVVDDMVHRYESWLECVPQNQDRRGTALALLPTLTRVSRTSLLCGELRDGGQAEEQDGFKNLCRAAGVKGALFHKRPLDSSEAGFELSHDVTAAIDDVAGTQLVACVLNTIDDALDRSDPGGTSWNASNIKHLRPLLDAARRSGRIVVLTSDHGHVIERREGRSLAIAGASSNRSRPTTGTPAEEGEVRVHGARVLLHGGDAILAVDERLRYGNLKAGYHGGGAPAEVVVPVCVLTPAREPEGWRYAPPQSPDWWRGPVAVEQSAEPPAPSAASPRSQQTKSSPTLFDVTAPAPTPREDLATAVVASSTYRDQRSRAARVLITNDQVSSLLRALLAAPANRLDNESAAASLGIATVQFSGALGQVQRLLNVEQYPVLSRDADGVAVVLDTALLCEQFEVAE